MNLYEWARAWGIPLAAIQDLQLRLGVTGTPDALLGASEAAVQTRVLLEASRKGARLFRNNVGALKDETGRVVRYGLANDSATVNAHLKSADLIGIRPVLIGQHHVGSVIGQFVSREIKEGGWQYSGTKREQAQLAWAELIASLGGDACFATGEGTL